MTYSQVVQAQSFRWAGGGGKLIHTTCQTSTILYIVDVSMLYHHLGR